MNDNQRDVIFKVYKKCLKKGMPLYDKLSSKEKGIVTTELVELFGNSLCSSYSVKNNKNHDVVYRNYHDKYNDLAENCLQTSHGWDQVKDTVGLMFDELVNNHSLDKLK